MTSEELREALLNDEETKHHRTKFWHLRGAQEQAKAVAVRCVDVRYTELLDTWTVRLYLGDLPGVRKIKYLQVYEGTSPQQAHRKRNLAYQAVYEAIRDYKASGSPPEPAVRKMLSEDTQ